MNVGAIGSYVHSPVNQTTSIKTESVDEITYENNDDRVSISSNSISLLENFMDGAGEDGSITLDEMREFRDKKLASVQNILRDTLNNLNIKSNGRLEIGIDQTNNTVIVSGDTDKNNRAIAKALQKNDQFRDAWAAASGTSTLIAAAEESIQFREAYSSDPNAAVAKYSWLIGKEWDFNMYFEDGEIDYSVT
jgi:hypothetical protein